MAKARPRTTTHGVMFHHFHGGNHPIGQGSLTAEEFEEMIDYLGAKFNLLSAAEYANRLADQRLGSSDICFTFDDALLCQTEIAVPIMRRKGISAFFFVYSSPFLGNPDCLEIFRYFRTAAFSSVNEFYEVFTEASKADFPDEVRRAEKSFNANSYLSEFSFYTVPDKWFRFLRDVALGKERYEAVMRAVMHASGFEPQMIMKKLWMDDNQLRALQADGHVVGLHTFSHPTTMDLLDRATQADEYQKNEVHLHRVLNEKPTSMSHPCGRYNEDTLAILRDMGVKIGFRSNYAVPEIRSHLEVPREDHTNIYKEMRS